MRFNSALPILTLVPASIHAFQVGSINTNPTGITSTTLEARRFGQPMLRRRRASMFFPEVDRMFQEIDEIMDNSFCPPSMMALKKKNFAHAQGLGLRQPLGFDVTQDEKEFKVSMNLSDVDVKDIVMQLDADGRVLRVKGNKVQEEGGMKIQSSFEKAILLHPDVETDKISASFDEGVLSIVAPKLVKEEVEEKKAKKIEIQVMESKSEKVKAAAEDNFVASEVDEKESPNVPTRLAVENMKNEKVNLKIDEIADNDLGEKKWPARDFPY